MVFRDAGVRAWIHALPPASAARWREHLRRRASDIRPAVLILLAVSATLGALGETVRALVPPLSWWWCDSAVLPGEIGLAIGVLLLPARTGPLASRARMFIDVSMTVTASAAFSWYFVVGPMVLRYPHESPQTLLRMAAPLVDLALLFAAMLLWTRLRDITPRRAAAVLGPALVWLAMADGVRYYLWLHTINDAWHVVSLVRITAFVLAALAIAAVGRAAPHHPHMPISLHATPTAIHLRSMPSVWRYLLPYTLVPAVVVLMVCAGRTHASARLDSGVYFIGAALIEFVFVHQYLAYRELMSYSTKNARLESLAAADPVTGLPNHRSVITLLSRELDRSRDASRSCSVLFLDLDHFKALNDAYGHRLGDEALREFAAVARVALRETDSFGRWGGEEFVALLPDTEVVTATAVGERIRVAVAEHAFRSVGGGHLTCSVGVAGFPGDAADRDALLEVADRAMYAAKRGGRNRVCAAVDAVALEVRDVGSRDDVALAGIVDALGAMVEASDATAGARTRAVSDLAGQLAFALGLDAAKVRMLEFAGRLLDVGTVSLANISLRKPAPLVDEEWTAVRTHPVVSASVVDRVPALRALVPIIRAHHEWWNGCGYPDGIAGEDIPLGARILAVADAYVAMTSNRPHQPAKNPSEALDELCRCAGTQFDPLIVATLENVLVQVVALPG